MQYNLNQIPAAMDRGKTANQGEHRIVHISAIAAHYIEPMDNLPINRDQPQNAAMRVR